MLTNLKSSKPLMQMVLICGRQAFSSRTSVNPSMFCMMTSEITTSIGCVFAISSAARPSVTAPATSAPSSAQFSMRTTGLPLPFFSAGGTSISIFMGAVGILLNISRYSPR